MNRGILFLGIILFMSRASAVPLLRQTEANAIDHLATVYPDHADPHQYYFLPNTGRFAKNAKGEPLFGLTTYGLNDANPTKGGGWMTFTLEATITPEHVQETIQQAQEFLDAAQRYLQSGRT